MAAALLGSAAGMGIAARMRSDEIAVRLNSGTQSPPRRLDGLTDTQIADLYTEGRTFDRAAIGLLAAGSAVALTSVVLFLLDGQRGRTLRPSLAAALGPARGDLLIRWRF